MGLFGGSDSDSEDEEETDLSEYQTSSVDSYISNQAEKKMDSLSVDEMVENAWSSTVTRRKLTEKKFDANIGNKSIFTGESLSYHLQKGEQPHFIFHAQGNHPQKDGEKFLKSHHSGGFSVCFTNKRILLVAGMEDGDSTESIQYSDLEGYETSKGRLKHRISLVTNASKYDIYISNYYGRNDLEELSKFLDGDTSLSDRSPSKESDSTSKNMEDNSTDESVDERKAKEIAHHSSCGTVTKKRLTGTKDGNGFTNEPIMSYLNDDEEVWHIMTDKKGGIRGEGFKKESHKSGKTAFVFTDSRIIAIVPGETEDETVEIEYDAIVDYSPTSDIYYEVSDYTIGVSRATLKISTDDNWYELRILPKYDDECEEWIESIRKRMHDEYVDILLSNGVGRIGMEILDRETGEANMDTSGWNYGLGFVERHKSSSEIEKEGYETYASDFVITESGVQVTYNQFDGGSVSMHRSFDEIGAVDMTNSGFILYTSSGIYKFSFKYYDKNWGKYTVDMERMQEVGEYIRSKVGEAKSEENDSSDSEDEIDKLERLADLKDEGILSEEEFKEKKQELLDEI